jgi:hypothetical protein
MKKLLVILAIGAFASCNDSATTDSTTTTKSDSSSRMSTDTMVAPMATPDTMSKMSGDTSKMSTNPSRK